MALSDPHSHTTPARVVHISLDLNVDFDRKVLKGIAILKIKRIPLSKEVILDTYGLNISRVTNFFTGSILTCETRDPGIFGSKLTVQLKDCENPCQIKIEYETHPDSPALYWLEPHQTAGGKHPFLLSNNKYTFARAIFPCQDTPSVKFTYHAKIETPLDFTVLMSAPLESVAQVAGQKYSYIFRQETPIPSYAVIIAVGNLQCKSYNSFNVWVDKSSQTTDTVLWSLSQKIQRMLEIVNNLYGSCPWALLNICVLPPSVSHFEIECPCLIFVSPTLIDGDLSLMGPVARNIAKNWTGILVTCANFEHLWLNESLSIYIYKRILDGFFPADINKFMWSSYVTDMKDKIASCDSTLVKCLIPNLSDLLPHENTQYVFYERGCFLLMRLIYILGGVEIFNKFLQSYFSKFAGQSIKTDSWLSYFRSYFSDKAIILNFIDWGTWFHDPNTFPDTSYETMLIESNAKDACVSLATRWIDWNDVDNSPFQRTDMTGFYDLQKIYFLNHLRKSREILTEKKMRVMKDTYQFDNQNDEIRFAWLRLCIKNRWEDKVNDALEFAVKFSSPKFTCPIFQDLYDWTEQREKVQMRYLLDYAPKMLEEVKRNVRNILI